MGHTARNAVNTQHTGAHTHVGDGAPAGLTGNVDDAPAVVGLEQFRQPVAAQSDNAHEVGVQVLGPDVIGDLSEQYGQQVNTARACVRACAHIRTHIHTHSHLHAHTNNEHAPL